MERILKLLNEKNEYLSKFFAINEHELMNFNQGDFDNLDGFYKTREKILDLVKCIDDLIQQTQAEVAADAVTDEHKVEFEKHMLVKDEWVTQILGQDLQLLSFIEKEKTSIIRELQGVQKSKKILDAYQSQQMPPMLDEEA